MRFSILTCIFLSITSDALSPIDAVSARVSRLNRSIAGTLPDEMARNAHVSGLLLDVEVAIKILHEIVPVDDDQVAIDLLRRVVLDEAARGRRRLDEQLEVALVVVGRARPLGVVEHAFDHLARRAHDVAGRVAAVVEVATLDPVLVLRTAAQVSEYHRNVLVEVVEGVALLEHEREHRVVDEKQAIDKLRVLRVGRERHAEHGDRLQARRRFVLLDHHHPLGQHDRAQRRVHQVHLQLVDHEHVEMIAAGERFEHALDDGGDDAELALARLVDAEKLFVRVELLQVHVGEQVGGVDVEAARLRAGPHQTRIKRPAVVVQVQQPQRGFVVIVDVVGDVVTQFDRSAVRSKRMIVALRLGRRQGFEKERPLRDTGVSAQHAPDRRHRGLGKCDRRAPNSYPKCCPTPRPTRTTSQTFLTKKRLLF
uniref:Uncharacterized protein n=1 Tax=Lymantria dispar multicapsid nuclear polyhedrosis virus TaxID=10449 RepID=A0A144HWP8_NPVLD|nr:hypothetical protein [Lymantria dispar multiple nucleopolyhedrovirus]